MQRNPALSVSTDDPWAVTIVTATRSELAALADPERADPMAAYMRHVAPFLGIAAPARRAAQRRAWAPLGRPLHAEALLAAACDLWALPEREYAYAAGDLLAKHQAAVRLDPTHLAGPVARLLVDRPWWDTVDVLVSGVVSPVLRRAAPAERRDLVDRWSESGDRWLVRAAIGHQRGWRAGTETDEVIRLARRHWSDPEFFVAKAIGWALRDLTRQDPAAVAALLEWAPSPNRVAEREARRGLARAGG